MLLIKDNQIQTDPLIDLVNGYSFWSELPAAIDEYIINNQQKTMVAGEPLSVFYVSGLAKQRHKCLADYLNSTVLKTRDPKAELTAGTFADFPIRHFWLKIGDLIVDITIKQFADKNIGLPVVLKSIFNHRYFICDNPDNHFYQLYQ